MTSEVLGSCPEFVLAEIGERFSIRRTPHGTEVWWHVRQLFRFPKSLCERVSTLVRVVVFPKFVELIAGFLGRFSCYECAVYRSYRGLTVAVDYNRFVLCAIVS